MTTVAQWLAERDPAPPNALLRRLNEALGHDAERDATETSAVCLDAAERVAATVLGDEEASRDYALDLLTADALVTYAFEAASARPGELSSCAARATERFASLGAQAPSGTSPRA